MASANHDFSLHTKGAFDERWLVPRENSVGRVTWVFPYLVHFVGQEKPRTLEVIESLSIKNTAEAAEVQFVGRLATGWFATVVQGEGTYSLNLSFEQPDIAMFDNPEEPVLAPAHTELLPENQLTSV